jgi:hypothetical protein
MTYKRNKQQGKTSVKEDKTKDNMSPRVRSAMQSAKSRMQNAKCKMQNK